MGIKFETLCKVLAATCVVFFGIFYTIPTTYVATYGATPTPSSDFMAQRAAPILLGIAVMVWMMRKSLDPVVQRAVCFGGAVIFLGIAATGFIAFLQGVASGTILIAALSEVLVGGFLVLYGRTR